ncbi:TonB-dependent receptor [Sphingomonas sp. A2-49]|uniref:TonB-dependent receptor n=1 Tax=Sphingomonas sp. A2-49 TaxID=1391375 RepID=UPI0021CE3A50|nr:TonB-dependent receptor [Sphingomonas sp. A2-49]MCU6453396.1 TonB-dependent receptor [Sphingomonas sp. A2-49]
MRFRTGFRLQLLLSGGLLATTASPVFAQSVPSSDMDASVEQQSPASGSSSTADDSLADIVVTATKRETNLQQTPISISVLSAEVIRDRKIQSLLDLADGGVPGLRIATFEARQSALTIGIRGIVPLDANQPAREQGVGVYIDGVYLGRQHGLNAALFDVERIEVLKGPQGTLFGRNTEGGALSLVTRAPSGKFGGRAEGGFGNLGGRNASLHLDLPQVAGFSVKLDGVIQHQDDVTRNPLAGQRGWGYYNRKGLRAAVRWQPVDGITNDFAYDVARDENTPFYSQLLNYNPNGCLSGGTNAAPLAVPAGSTCVTPGTAFTGTQGTVRSLLPGVVVNGDTLQRVADIGVPQQVSVDKTFGFTNAFKWQIAPEIELRSITAWRGVDVQQFDNSGGAHRVPVVNLTAACAGANCGFSRYSLADLRQRQFSQEFQAVGTVGIVDYVAGLYYFNERVSDDAATPNSMGATAVLTNGVVTGATYAPIPFCTASTPLFVGTAVNGCSIDRASVVRSRSYAAYGQVTLNATDALHVTVGGRYTIDKKTGALTFSRNINYATNPTAAAANGYAPLDKESKRFNPLVTVAYDFTDRVHGYAKYATGYRAGGASSRTSNYQAFNPEDVKSYEIGLKTDFFDRRARFNVAAYIMNRKGSQVDLSTIQPTATGNFNNLVTFNAPGTTKIRGIEADLTVQPVDNLTLSASYAYTYTDIPLVPVTYREFSAAGVPTGNLTTVDQKFFIVFTPRNAASGAIDYAVPFGGGDTRVKFHLDANYAQATQTFDQFATKADASFIVNGRINLADIGLGSGGGQTLTIGIWSRNLFNEHYVYRRDPSNSLPAVQTTAAAGVPNVLRVGNNGGILGDYGNFNVPRTFGVDASLRF